MSSTSNEEGDLSKLPKWILVKLRDEMVLRQELENQLSSMKKELQQTKENAEQWMRENVERFEEDLKKAKAKNYENLVQAANWKKEKEQEHEESLAERDATIAHLRHQISSAIQEIELWKHSQDSKIQQILKAKDAELENCELEIKKLKETIKTLKGFGRGALKNNEEIVTEMRDVYDTMEHRGQHYVSSGSMGNLIKLQEEVTARRGSDELKSKVEAIQLEIADLIIRKQKQEYIIMEAERAKQEVPQIEKQLLQRRKDLTDVMKDIKTEKILKAKQKQRTEDIENKLSIVVDVNQRKLLIKKGGKLAIVPIQNNIAVTSLSGPDDNEKMMTGGDGSIACKSISLYPIDSASKRRMGDPIADRYSVVQFNDRGLLFAVCDGAGWGVAVREAALKASNTFVTYLKDIRTHIGQTNHSIRHMLRALSVAHQAVISGKDAQTMYDAGTTTILGGMTFRLHDQKSKQVVVFTSLGDCKLYHYSVTTKKVTDLTFGNRTDFRDLRDPGGRLGPMKGEKGEPELKNLNTGHFICDDGDYLVVVSDGIHDNLDPVYAGKTPKDLGLTVKDNKWNNVENEEAVRYKYQLKVLSEMISECHEASEVTNKLIEYARDITSKSRNFMEIEGRPQPNDLTKFPGKMDHATVTCFKLLGPQGL